MSSLAATQADGYYLPPEYYESGARSKNEWHRRQQKNNNHKKNTDNDGTTTVRFELADPCVCLRCDARIGKGTRFNAVKRPCGVYHHSTVVYEFTMRCRRCGAGNFVVQTDPANRGFSYSGDLRVQKRSWDAATVHGVSVDDDTQDKATTADPLAQLERHVQGQRQAATERQELEALLQRNTVTAGDDAAQNALLRQAARRERRDHRARQAQAHRYGWRKVELQKPAVADDAEAQSQVFTSQRAQGWKQVKQASIFGARTVQSSSSSSKPPTPKRSRSARKSRGGSTTHTSNNNNNNNNNNTGVQPDPVVSAPTATTHKDNNNHPPRPKRRLVLRGKGRVSLAAGSLAMVGLVAASWAHVTSTTTTTNNNNNNVALRYTVDLSHNDPALRSLRQAACTYVWAPSAVHGHGVYTARDLPRKYTDTAANVCFVVPRWFMEETQWTTPLSAMHHHHHTNDDDSVVLCQGLLSLLNHMPHDASRAATSKWTLLNHDNPTDGPFYVTTTTHHKVKAGAELTTDYGRSSKRFHVPTNKIPHQDPVWLRQHGQCLDGLLSLTTTRPWAAGEVLAPSPVVSLSNWTETIRPYCLSVVAQSMVYYYFPYGPGVGALLASSRGGGGGGGTSRSANVALRWSDAQTVEVYALRRLVQGERLVLQSSGNIGMPPALEKKAA